jgi:hypothetical protein
MYGQGAISSKAVIVYPRKYEVNFKCNPYPLVLALFEWMEQGQNAEDFQFLRRILTTPGRTLEDALRDAQVATYMF